jgi:hypothetical protein
MMRNSRSSFDTCPRVPTASAIVGTELWGVGITKDCFAFSAEDAAVVTVLKALGIFEIGGVFDSRWTRRVRGTENCSDQRKHCETNAYAGAARELHYSKTGGSQGRQWR